MMGSGLGGQAYYRKGRPLRGVKAEGLAPGWSASFQREGVGVLSRVGTEPRTQPTGARASENEPDLRSSTRRWRAWKEALV